MFLILVILFVGGPIVEIALLIRVVQWISFGPALAIVLGTGVLGAVLARRQGFRTWASVQKQLAEGAVPGFEIVEGILIFVAGVLLIVPGIVTDVLGLLLLVPPVRRWFARRLIARFRMRMHVVDAHGPVGDEMIDVEVREVRVNELGDGS